MAVSARALRAGRATIELSLLTKGVERGLRSLQNRVRTISRSFLRIGSGGILGQGGMGGFGGGFASLRGLFVGAGATALLSWPVKMAANLEHSAAQMAAFVGSAEKAREIIVGLQKSDAIQLIPVEDLAQSVAMLLRFQIDAGRAVEMAETMAIVAGGSTEEFHKLSLALAQVNEAGQLTGEEWRQLKNTAFNPFREIAKATGETMGQVRDRMKAGAVSAEEVNVAFLNTTRAGGVFEHMLSSISKTAKGKFAKLKANIALAVLPLGDALLTPIKKFLDVLNSLTTPFEAFIKNSANAIARIITLAAGLVAAATAFITLGLGLTLVSIAIGGFVALFSTLAAAIGIVISPLTLIGVVLYKLVSSFSAVREAGASMVQSFSGWFMNIFDIAKSAFGGVVDSLMAGDIALAGTVAMNGLYLAFLEGTQRIKDLWIDLKDTIRRLITDLSFDAQRLGVEVGFGIIGLARKLGLNSGLLANFAGPSAKAQALADITAEQNRFNSANDTIATDERAAAKKSLQDAQGALEAARKEAAAKAAATKVGAAADKAAIKFGGLGAIGGVEFKAPGGIFDARFARQILGASTDDIQKKQLNALNKVVENTKPRPGGVPFV